MRGPVLAGLGLAGLAATGWLVSASPPAPLAVAPPVVARFVSMDSVLARAGELRPLTSLLITQRGESVIERYYRGMTPERTVNLKSVSKTLLSPLIGIAIREGYIAGPDQPVAELLDPRLTQRLEPVKQQITLHHLLTMTAGLQGTSFSNYGPWVSSRNWVRHALDRPMRCDPGTCWGYSTGNTHILSAVLTRATGKSTLAFARTMLFEPLGIRLGAWDRDPQGIYLGGNNMRLRPKDLLAIGQLYLDGGRYGGRQLVPEEWISAAWQPHSASRWNRNNYGYLWWSRELGGERVYYGWGYGGQFLYVVPQLEAAIVLTSTLDGRRDRGHNRDVHRLVGRYVIPALRQWPARAALAEGASQAEE
jgi:CubicO group peptidase (beta-lactamase class C family)